MRQHCQCLVLVGLAYGTSIGTPCVVYVLIALEITDSDKHPGMRNPERGTRRAGRQGVKDVGIPMQKRTDLNGGIDCMRPDAGPTDSKELKCLII